ncbi:hypothetical protein FRB95_014738 [Tulasnella sp. JGI-2019a]|nr:hypothetical protein FRB95_014738 [Tulasnella sp. JGI-2019a]
MNEMILPIRRPTRNNPYASHQSDYHSLQGIYGTLFTTEHLQAVTLLPSLRPGRVTTLYRRYLSPVLFDIPFGHLLGSIAPSHRLRLPLPSFYNWAVPTCHSPSSRRCSRRLSPHPSSFYAPVLLSHSHLFDQCDHVTSVF